jgi:hypothetical protein
LEPGDDPVRIRAGRMAEWGPPAAVVLVVAAVIAAFLVGPALAHRALRALPDEERLALLSRTVDELRQFCGEGRPDALRDHCRELASFAAQFDECRGDCEALVHRQLTPRPTR